MLMTLWHFIECCGIWEFVHSILVCCWEEFLLHRCTNVQLS